MTVFDQANELKENLPAFLTQEYDAGYEVIVVDETSTDDTSELLKLFKKEYTNLYTTFLPKPNRLIIRKKLAMNIGTKAAKNEWVIITDIYRKPTRLDLLDSINEVMDNSTEVILGYMGKKSILLQPFISYEDASSHIRRLEQKHYKMKTSYAAGRYDFIIVRKDIIYNVLKYFELKTSFIENFYLKTKIVFKNLLTRSGTIKLQATA